MKALIELDYYDGPTELIACTYEEKETLDGHKHQLPTWYYGNWHSEDDEGVRTYAFWPCGPALEDPEFILTEWELEWDEYERPRPERFLQWVTKKRKENEE